MIKIHKIEMVPTPRILLFLTLTWIAPGGTLCRILIKENGLDPFYPENSTLLTFYAVIVNLEESPISVELKMIECCQNVGFSEMDCESMNLLGGISTSLQPGDTARLELYYANLYLTGRVGHCILRVVEEGEDLEESNKESEFTIDFDTSLPKAPFFSFLFNRDYRKFNYCSSIDDDPYCSPVNCLIKYHGFRSFYNETQKRCLDNPDCSLERGSKFGSIETESKPKILYSKTSNKCKHVNRIMFSPEMALLEKLDEAQLMPSIPIMVECNNGNKTAEGGCICIEGWTSKEFDPSTLTPEKDTYQMCTVRTPEGLADDQAFVANSSKLLLLLLVFLLLLCCLKCIHYFIGQSKKGNLKTRTARRYEDELARMADVENPNCEEIIQTIKNRREPQPPPILIIPKKSEKQFQRQPLLHSERTSPRPSPSPRHAEGSRRQASGPNLITPIQLLKGKQKERAKPLKNPTELQKEGKPANFKEPQKDEKNSRSWWKWLFPDWDSTPLKPKQKEEIPLVPLKRDSTKIKLKTCMEELARVKQTPMNQEDPPAQKNLNVKSKKSPETTFLFSNDDYFPMASEHIEPPNQNEENLQEKLPGFKRPSWQLKDMDTSEALEKALTSSASESELNAKLKKGSSVHLAKSFQRKSPLDQVYTRESPFAGEFEESPKYSDHGPVSTPHWKINTPLSSQTRVPPRTELGPESKARLSSSLDNLIADAYAQIQQADPPSHSPFPQKKESSGLQRPSQSDFVSINLKSTISESHIVVSPKTESEIKPKLSESKSKKTVSEMLAESAKVKSPESKPLIDKSSKKSFFSRKDKSKESVKSIHSEKQIQIKEEQSQPPKEAKKSPGTSKTSLASSNASRPTTDGPDSFTNLFALAPNLPQSQERPSLPREESHTTKKWLDSLDKKEDRDFF